jgi:hypothetical protein
MELDGKNGKHDAGLGRDMGLRIDRSVNQLNDSG